jgi:hypothetical protein
VSYHTQALTVIYASGVLADETRNHGGQPLEALPDRRHPVKRLLDPERVHRRGRRRDLE